MRAVVLWWQRALCTLRPIQTAIDLVLLSRQFLLQLRLPLVRNALQGEHDISNKGNTLLSDIIPQWVMIANRLFTQHHKGSNIRRVEGFNSGNNGMLNTFMREAKVSKRAGKKM